MLSKRHRQGILQTNLPFNPVTKRSLVAIMPNEKSEYIRIVIKGAPEYIMPMCTT